MNGVRYGPDVPQHEGGGSRHPLCLIPLCSAAGTHGWGRCHRRKLLVRGSVPSLQSGTRAVPPAASRPPTAESSRPRRHRGVPRGIFSTSVVTGGEPRGYLGEKKTGIRGKIFHKTKPSP